LRREFFLPYDAGMGAFFLALFLAGADPAGACTDPNIPTRAIKLAPPDSPGVYGTVDILVTLDAASTVTNVEVERSDEPLMNAFVVSAAKRSTFTTQIVNCEPVASVYRLTLSMGRDRPAASPPKSETDPSQYLSGSWTCTDTHNGNASAEVFTPDPASATIAHGIGSRTETFANILGAWHLRNADGTIDETARSWARHWLFQGTVAGKPAATSYSRIDANSFVRSTDDPSTAYGTYRLETCKRAK
jgi:hypothetical protein